MTFIQEFLRIILAFLLFLLPAAGLAALLRLSPLYRRAQYSRSARTSLVLGTALLCFGLYYSAFAWFIANAIYSIARFYFDTSFGVLPGVTPAQVEQFKRGIIGELWLRVALPFRPGGACFNENSTICQLAEKAGSLASPESMSLIVLALALFSALVCLLMGWRFTRPPADAGENKVTVT